MFDIQKIRANFPILNRSVNNKQLIYFDNAATSQLPRVVIDTISNYYTTYNSNIHRGIHTLSSESTIQYELARQKVANFIHAKSADEIIFTRNATEGINLIAQSWLAPNIKPKDEIILTIMEHHSNIVPWVLLNKKYNKSSGVYLGDKIKINFLPLTTDRALDINKLDKLLTKHPKLVSLTHLSNVLGTINPIQEIIKKCHEASALVCVDASQSIAHLPINVQDLDCDFLVLSGHKMFGPSGIGAIYVKKRILEKMIPFLGGGEMVKDVSLDYIMFNELPYRFEAGTPNIAGAIGLGAAIDFLNSLDRTEIIKYENKLNKYLLKKSSAIDAVHIYSPLNPNLNAPIMAFNVGDIHSHDLASILDKEGIAIRSGHHCAKPLITTFKTSSVARASLTFYNTFDEIDKFILAIQKAKRLFRI